MTGQIIDSLVLKVIFDTTDVKKSEQEVSKSFKNVKDDAKKTGDEMEARGAQAASFFGQIQNKVLGLAAAYLGFGAIKQELVSVTNATADLGRTAAVTGANVQQLSAFGNMIERNGGNAAAATTQMQGFIQSLERFKVLGQGSSELQMFLGTIGAGANDTWLDDMRKFSEFAERNKNDPARVALIGSMGGITDNAMLSQLMKGPQTFDAELERSRRLGVALDQDAAAARNLQDSFHGLGQAIDNNARHFVTKITEPGSLTGEAIASLLAGLTSFVDTQGHGPSASVDLRWSDIKTFKKDAVPHVLDGEKIDPAALIRKLESSGDRAVSPKGAIGRYQIMPGTAHQYMGAGYDTSKLFDPAENERHHRCSDEKIPRRPGRSSHRLSLRRRRRR